ncbi:MAG: hypothetical protein LBU29_01090 [Endomicrobium sp.]|jgi:regulator of replication initiation timing|nr:hypothetical protein [Endomicrobium sp.]
MENIEILALKVKKITEKLKVLIDENNKLRLEVGYLRKENERSKKCVGEYVVLKKNTDEVAAIIERIIKKIDTIEVP